jgi:hypothetical protein
LGCVGKTDLKKISALRISSGPTKRTPRQVDTEKIFWLSRPEASGASDVQHKQSIPPCVIFELKCSMKFNSPLPSRWQSGLAEEMLNRGNTRHQNRLCFLCYFLCTSKESNEKDDECLYLQISAERTRCNSFSGESHEPALRVGRGLIGIKSAFRMKS